MGKEKIMGLFGRKKESKVYANIAFVGDFSLEFRKRFRSELGWNDTIRRAVAGYVDALPGPSATWFFDEWCGRTYSKEVVDKVFDNGFDDAFDEEREEMHKDIIDKLRKEHGLGLIDSGQNGIIHPRCVVFKEYYIIICNARVSDNSFLKW